MENENQNDPVDQSANAGGNVESDGKNNNSDVVDYNSFKKAVDEKKLFQSRLQETEAELSKLREADMKRKGKTDELLTQKEQRIKELEAKLENTSKTYVWSTIEGEIKREAIKQGCKNPDKFIRLMSDDDLKNLSQHVGEDFKIAPDALKETVSKNKTDNYFLFSDSSKKVVTGNPNTKVDDVPTDLSKLSLDELRELHKKTYK